MRLIPMRRNSSWHFSMGSKDLNINSVLEPPFRSGKSFDLLQGMAAFYQIGTFSRARTFLHRPTAKCGRKPAS